MLNRTEILIAKYIQNRSVYDHIGCGEISRKELLEYMATLSATMARSDMARGKINISELEPLLIESRPNYYAIDLKTLSMTLYDFYKVFLPGIFTYERMRELTQKYLRGKLLCDADEVELNKQSYKYLYESLLKEHKNLNEGFHTQRFKLDECQHELASMSVELQNLKDSASTYADSTQNLMQFIKDLLHKDIQVCSVNAVDSNGEKIQTASDRVSAVALGDIASCPGIYGFKRPSWFTKLQVELNKKNAGQKVAKNTIPLLKEILQFWEKLNADNLPLEEKADAVDRRRMNEIVRLINDKSISNEEKYIRYILLTPGMSKDYMKTLNGASELGLSADIVIKMLEQPAESFNKEIIEAYVSKAHKGLEYNLKQELAEELIRGEWSIRANMNGTEEIFQLVPYAKLQELVNQFEKVYAALEKQTDSLGATMARSESDDEQHNEITSENFDQAWEDTLNNSFEDDDFDFSGFDKEAF